MIKNRRSFIIGLKSTILLPNEKKFLKKFKPWGVILFSRNIKTLLQTKKLTNEIRKIFQDINYPILVDQEGGRVSRTNSILESSNFSAYFFGKLYRKNIKQFKIYQQIFIKQNSYLLKSLGININTVPVLDIKYKNASSIIGDRAFSSDPKIISKIGDYCIKMYHKHSIGTVIKHIPGHGLAKKDSHKFTPIVTKKIKYLYKKDFLTFKNKNSFFAMTAHVIYQNVDKIFTATHSKKIIKLIRDKINFKNLLISDDISMKALKFSVKKNTVMAFKAGCNLVLHSNGNLTEMITVAQNSPKVNQFIVKKTSQFYKILS